MAARHRALRVYLAIGDSTLEKLERRSALQAELGDVLMARTLVGALYATILGETPGLEIAHLYEAAGEGARVGGDLIDAYAYRNGDVSVLIADIAGHGTLAAMHAAMIKYSVRAYASQTLLTDAVVRALNVAYMENCAFDNVESFASVFLAVFDVELRHLTYTNAGHELALLVPAHGHAELLAPNAPLVGVLKDETLFGIDTISLMPGDMLVLATDGISEARSSTGELYGTERFIEYTNRHRAEPAKRFAYGIVEEARQFSGGRAFRDDVAIVVLRVSA